MLIRLLFSLGLFIQMLCVDLPVMGVTRTHIKREGANLVSNPNFLNASGWYRGGDAVFDQSVSRDAGSGSLKLTTASSGAPQGSCIYSKLIPVEPGEIYTFALYSKTDAWPSELAMHYEMLDASMGFIKGGSGSEISLSTGGVWQESAIFVVPKVDTRYIKLIVNRQVAPRNDGHIWIDNLYFGKGIGFEQPPSEKTSFNAAQTRVDNLGNIEILKNGVWTPFFPICVYADDQRKDWKIYSQQGFNCNMWASEASNIQKAKSAISDFNPDGMYSGFDITGYVKPKHPYYNNTVLLTARINGIKSAGVMDRVLMYYWDNETDRTVWDTQQNVIGTIKRLDVDWNGNRMHPIYALHWHYGIARMYLKERMTNIVGGYMGQGNSGGWPDGLTILNNIEKQTNPVVIGQINLYGADLLSPTVWRRRFYDIILSGGKGIGWWRDCVSSTCPSYSAYGLVPFEQTGLFKELPKLRREIDQLLPIIREPDWTKWSFSSSDSSVRYGTREHAGEGYLIVINTKDSPVTTTFSTTNLPYIPVAVNDYFTGSTIAPYASNSSFTVTLPANATAVYRLVSGVSITK